MTPAVGYVVRVPRDEKGVYKPDDIQIKASQLGLDFFKKRMPAPGLR